MLTADTLLYAMKTSALFLPECSHVRDLHLRKSQAGQLPSREGREPLRNRGHMVLN